MKPVAVRKTSGFSHRVGILRMAVDGQAIRSALDMWDDIRDLVVDIGVFATVREEAARE